MSRFHTAILTLLLLLARPLAADTFRIDIGELANALNASGGDAGQLDIAPVEALLLDTLREQLDLAEVQFQRGDLLFQRGYVDTEVEGGCNNTNIRRMQLEIGVAQASALSLSISSLDEPISVRFQLQAQLNASGRARQEFGIRLGSCQLLASDSFDFTASGQVDADLHLELFLNPQTLAVDTIQFTPRLALRGQLVSDDIRVQVEDSLLRNLLEDFLEAELRDALAPGAVDDQLDALQQSLQDQLIDSGSSSVELQLPDVGDEQIASLYQLLAGQSRLPLTLSFVRNNRFALLVALLTGNTEMLSAILTDAASCELAQSLARDLPRQLLYRVNDGACEATDPLVAGERLYADALCQSSVEFYSSDFADYCQLILNEQALGNAAMNSDQLAIWTLSAGNTLDISARSMAGLQQPYMQRMRYKTTFSERGACELEMRIYTAHPAVSGRRAILAFHGGSWQYRPTGFVGLEVMATHLSNAGYVVFAPFYRLLGDRDGPKGCRNVQLQDVLSDANDALDWVLANAQQFGAGGRPALFGQSAGAHLAAALAVARSGEVARAGLFYGPVDFADFIENLQSGGIESSAALDIIETVANAPLESLDRDTPVVADNSFPAIVAANPQRMPPLFIMHGELDELVPFRQASRLCNALGGDPAGGQAPCAYNLQSLRRIISCDANGSELHLLAQGAHALDICIADGICASGDQASAAATGESIERMLDWMAPDAIAAPLADDIATETGAGGSDWRFACGSLLLLVVVRWRQKISGQLFSAYLPRCWAVSVLLK